MRKYIYTLLLLFFLNQSLFPVLHPGDTVPSIVFRSSEGRLVFINDFVGEPRILKPKAPRQVTLLVFFRTDDQSLNEWLKPLTSTLDKFDKRKLRTFFVSADEKNSDIKNFKKSNKFKYSLVIDRYLSALEALDFDSDYDFKQFPYIMIIEKDGSINEVYPYFSTSSITDIEEILKLIL